MALIKQISVYGGTNWVTRDIGANAGNIDLIAPSSTVTTNLAGSSNLFTALNNILPTNQLTASRVVITDANKKLTSSDITSTQLGYLSNVSGNIQSQINSVNNTLVTTTQFIPVGFTYHLESLDSGTTTTQTASIYFNKSELLSYWGPRGVNATLFGCTCSIDNYQLPYISSAGYTRVSAL